MSWTRTARLVVRTMKNRGGEHAEEDIPAIIQRARTRHTEVDFVYAWPFRDVDVARFLAAQIRRSGEELVA